MPRRFVFSADGYIHSRKDADAAVRMREKVDGIEHLSKEALVRNYLCKRAKSGCVTKGCCEMLDECRFGKRYIELAKAETENE